MKRAKRLTRKQQKQAKKIFDDLQANLPKIESKPRKIKSIVSLTHYLQKQAEKKHAKQHEREDKRAAKADKRAIRDREKAVKKAAREAKEAKRAARLAKDKE